MGVGTKHIKHTPLIYSIENVYQVQDKNRESLEFDALMQKMKELSSRRHDANKVGFI